MQVEWREEEEAFKVDLQILWREASLERLGAHTVTSEQKRVWRDSAHAEERHFWREAGLKRHGMEMLPKKLMENRATMKGCREEAGGKARNDEALVRRS